MVILCEQTFELINVIEVDFDGFDFEDLVSELTHLGSTTSNDFVVLYLVNQHLSVHRMEWIFFVALDRSSEHSDS
jgi:hypothetical protein